jgi:predicted ABC-class ATPase
MNSYCEDDLRQLLKKLDGAPYSQYKRLRGSYALGDFKLAIDHVPPDPFAGSARIRLVAGRGRAALPPRLASNAARRIGTEDYLAREAESVLQEQISSPGKTGPASGRIRIESCRPEVIERSACRITGGEIELRLFVDLPASGRRIRGLQAEKVLLDNLPLVAKATLLFSADKIARATEAAENVEDHIAIQEELRRRGLIAFIADGSLLARAGGEDPGPRRDGQEVAFQSPEELRVTVNLPHAGEVVGLGIPAGVTLIVGGGFHGKSTLLEAVAMGVYPHHLGDGRERVATIPEAVVIRAEDGRSVRSADISAFLGELPSGARSGNFSSDKASGSTSQASAIVEALEVGAKLLLLDEDRCATNFMVRDGRMQRLVPRPAEPIIPFLDRVRELYDRFGVSTLLVTGGSGDYLEVADKVIRMEAYVPHDATAAARQIAEQTSSMRLHEKIEPMSLPAARQPRIPSAMKPRALRSGLRGPRRVRLGQETVSLAALEQIAETGQVRTLALLMKMAAERARKGIGLGSLIDQLEAWLDERGLDGLDVPVAYDLSRPRRYELAAALNRWRSLQFVIGRSENR